MTTTYPRISEDILQAIGNMVVRSSQLEWHAERLLHVAFHHQPNTAEFLLKQLGADRVVGLIKSVLLDAAPDKKEEIDNLDLEIKRLKRERNNVMHWIWGETEETGIVCHVSARPFRDCQMRTKTAVEIDELAADMVGASKILVFWQDYLYRFSNA